MVDIDEELVRRLVTEQFPRWAHLPVAAVARQGWDNRTFRLGEHLVVRLPSAEGYVPGVAKEDGCLPALARHLPLPVPEPVATGAPGAGHPYPRSVRRWLPGDTLAATAEVDRPAVARDLGAFLTALRRAPTTGGPAAGRHSCFRGCHPSAYDDEVEQALAVLGGRVDTVGGHRLRHVWRRGIPPATWWRRGPGSPLRSAGCSGSRPACPTTPGGVPAAGRCGRRSSPSQATTGTRSRRGP
ncbi:phosphotransferase [Micromonospora sp. AP08]|uniref:phosphotransferase n=1 Tax=Micromonospora sp. AP08 TaxID=2604467 RepID=UPI001CA30CE8|nr:phosphotransferase [Micromonospora sp. AP08]